MWVCVAIMATSGSGWLYILAVIFIFVYSLIIAVMEATSSHIINVQNDLIETGERRVGQLQKLVDTQKKLIYKYKSLTILNGGEANEK